METQCEYLSFISGLLVKTRHEKGENVFDFYLPNGKIQIRTVFTYKKAKVFAEGVSAGRKLGDQNAIV